MRYIVGAILAVLTVTSVAQSLDSARPFLSEIRTTDHPPLFLASGDPADNATFVCNCTDVNGNKTSATCNKGQSCQCSGGAHCGN